MNQSSIPDDLNRAFYEDEAAGASWSDIPFIDATMHEEVPDQTVLPVVDDALPGEVSAQSIISYDDTLSPERWSSVARADSPWPSERTLLADDRPRPLSPIRGPLGQQPFSPQPGPSGFRPKPIILQSTPLDFLDRRDITGGRRIETPLTVGERHKEKFEKIWQTDNIDALRQFVKQNYQKIAWLGHLSSKLRDIILTFASAEQKQYIINSNWNLDAVLNVIRNLLEICKRKFEVIDAPYEYHPGFGSLSEIEESRRKMSDVIENLRGETINQSMEIMELKQKVAYMKKLEKQLENAKQYVRVMQEREKYAVADPMSQEEFMLDLQHRLATQEYLSSSLREELEQERKTKQELVEMFEQAEEQRIMEHNKRMQIYNEAMKYMEMHEVIREAIIPKIKTLKPKPAKLRKAVDEWLKAIADVIKEKEKDIYALTKRFRDLGETLKSLKIDLDNRNTEIEVTKLSIKAAKDMLVSYKSELENKEDELAMLSQDHQGRRGLDLSISSQHEVQTPEIRERSMPQDIERLSPEMKEVLRTASISPEYPEQLDDSLLIDPTPPRTSVLHSPSPPKSRSIHEINLPSPDLGTIKTSHSPYVTTPYPETPLVSKSRFGYTDPSVPFRQLNIPPGPFEAPTPFQQTILLTSPKREEPLLVNIGIDPKPLTETERGERFVCDISLDVQPGGHQTFPELPQISGRAILDKRVRSPVKSPGRIDSPLIKGRVGRYNIPPEITPTSTRRHGLFTPKGIFKKRQFNIRRIPGKHPIPELPWSPTYLPEYARSPVSPFPPSPYTSDRSISWEKSKESYGSSPSISPVIKGPRYRSPDWDHSSASPIIKRYRSPDWARSSPSPVIKRPSYRYRSPDWEQASPSPVIKRPSFKYRSSDSDYSSPSPLIKGPSYMHRSPDSEYSSPSPLIKGPSYRHRSPDWDSASPSPVIKEPSRRYPSPDWEFNLRSPVIKRSSYGYQSPDWQHTPTSPVIKGSSYRSSPDSHRSSPASVIISGTPDRFSPNRTFDSEALDYEGDYMERSLYDSSLLDEKRYFD